MAGGYEGEKRSGARAAEPHGDADEWQGFAPDLEATHPGPGALTDSETLRKFSERARERILIDNSLETLDEYQSTPRFVDARLTPQLHSVLIVDWRRYFQSNKLHKLPCDPSISTILAEYVSSRERISASMKSDTRELFAQGLLDCFRDRIRDALLYDDKERKALDKTLKDGLCPCDVYGYTHLVRLMARLPTILPSLPIAEEDLEETVAAHNDLVRHLDRIAITHVPEILDV